MQVILVKPVRKLGKVGNTVTVADGFGRNYLIPQEFAIRATKENIAKFSSLQKDMEAKNAENKVDAEKVVAAIKSKHITFITQSAAEYNILYTCTKEEAIDVINLINGIKDNNL